MFGKDFTVTAGSIRVAVVVTSSEVTSTLLAGKAYSFCTNTACYIKQGFGAQTASAGNNNVMVPAGGTVFIHGSNGTHLSVIRDTADGACTLNLMAEI